MSSRYVSFKSKFKDWFQRYSNSNESNSSKIVKHLLPAIETVGVNPDSDVAIIKDAMLLVEKQVMDRFIPVR